MNKIVAVILLGMYTLSIIHPDELMKVPTLVNHYKVHKRLNPEMTTWAFIVIHYGMGDLKGADYDKEDSKLPFKKPQNCLNHCASFFQSINNDYPSAHRPGDQTEGIINRQKNFRSNLYSNTIWQPPKCNT